MENENRTGGLKAFQGIIVAVLGILMLLFVAAPIQLNLGMAGLAITEILVLLLAILPALVLKGDLSVIFPVKVPKLRQIGGTILLWIGTYIGILTLTLIVGYLFPKSLNGTSSAIGNLITSVPAGMAFFIIAVMPAVCEEALMRGFILSSFRSFKSKWSIIILVGVIFGIFHLDFLRFFPTAILGMALAYIMLDTENILLPMLLHLINNGVATMAAFFASSSELTAGASMQVPLISIGAYLIIASAAPFIILTGVALLKDRKKANDSRKVRKVNPVYITAAATVALLISGIIVVSFSIQDNTEFQRTEYHVQCNEIRGDR